MEGLTIIYGARSLSHAPQDTVQPTFVGRVIRLGETDETQVVALNPPLLFIHTFSPEHLTTAQVVRLGINTVRKFAFTWGSGRNKIFCSRI